MKTRITITLDPRVHQHAKRTAKQRKTTVSGLIESLLENANDRTGKSSLVDQMRGSCELREPAPGSDPLYDALKARHLRAR